MAKLQLAAVKEPPARSAEREALAVAIAQHAEAAQYLEKVRAAASRAESLGFAAVRARDAAEEALAEAEEGEGAALAASIIAGGELATSPVEEAAEALAKAERAAGRARQARDLVRQQVPIAEQEIKWTADKRDEAVREVVQTAGGDVIARLLQEAKAMQDELVRRRVVLRFLWLRHLASEPEAKAIEHLLQDDALVTPTGSAELEYAQHAASLAWRDVVAKLSSDADAALPD
jgi:hypothetical protein